MTELDKIKRAKMYMDKLANGINPIDDSAAPEGDIINHVRVSRCFFFVSDVLRQIIENGGSKPTIPERKFTKLPLEIPVEKRERFAYSDMPIPASEIAKRINALADTDNMKKLTYSGIVTWLIQVGMLEAVSLSDGKQAKRPTEIGRENGIAVEERNGNAGPYQVVVYNTEAQHFIMDNLDAILLSARTKAAMQGRAWTREQETRLLELYYQNLPLCDISAALQRSRSAVRKRLKMLGIQV